MGTARRWRAPKPNRRRGSHASVTGAATVTANESGTLLEMDGDAFLDLVGAGPELRGRLLGLYAGAPGARGT